LDSRFSIGRYRAESQVERQLPIENRESKIENSKKYPELENFLPARASVTV
jgi:hypothetical protein